MDYLRVVLSSLFSVGLLFVITRLSGYRQMSQLSMFDYINGISIGSIAAELATAEGIDIINWTIALVVYGGMTMLLSLLGEKSVALRNVVAGKPILLYQNGNLLDKNFKHAKLDLSEFLMQLRGSGWFDLNQLDTVLFEPNGRLSILPKSEYRPVIPEDTKLCPPQEQVMVSVILDGKVLPDNLEQLGFDRPWLERQLELRELSLDTVFLAVCDTVGTLRIYPKSGGTD